MQKMSQTEKPWNEIVLEVTKKGGKLGYDPTLFSHESLVNRQKFFKEKKEIELVPVDQNLVDILWTDRPQKSLEEAFIHDVKYAGQSTESKLEELGKELGKTKGVRHLVIQNLDEIAWLLNMRGNDIDYNPYFVSFMIANFKEGVFESGTLYIRKEKISKKVANYLENLKFQTKEYMTFYEDLGKLTDPTALDKSKSNARILKELEKNCKEIKNVPSICQLKKSVKNEVQVKGFIDSCRRDSAALCQFFGWLENELVVKKNKDLTEHSVTVVLQNFRKQLPLYKGDSFPAISSIGENGAIIHYEASEKDCQKMKVDEVYLLDSGAHFWDGTTDVTRTLHFGEPTEKEREMYTRVLLGNLDVERTTWPRGRKYGPHDFDALARRWLWFAGQDYCHGTGHGIGHFSGCHETPPWIGRRKGEFKVGQVVSNEPGYYEEGAFGIRIENDLLVENQREGFMGFLNMTVVPYCANMLSKDLLSKRDLTFLNGFHQRCLKEVEPHLKEMKWDLGLQWLKKQAKTIE